MSDVVTSEVLSPTEGHALFDRACRRTLSIPGAVFLAAWDAGEAWDRWGSRRGGEPVDAGPLRPVRWDHEP